MIISDLLIYRNWVSVSLPDSSQPIMIVIVGVMMSNRWLEARVKENNRQEMPTKEQLQELDCLKDLDFSR